MYISKPKKYLLLAKAYNGVSRTAFIKYIIKYQKTRPRKHIIKIYV